MKKSQVRGFCPQRKNEGGMIRGPGTGTSDSIDAEMMPGTFIMPADSTKSIGPKALERVANAPAPVRVSNGEFEFTPAQVNAVGIAVLTALRNATHTPVQKEGQVSPDGVPGFFGGGVIGGPFAQLPSGTQRKGAGDLDRAKEMATFEGNLRKDMSVFDENLRREGVLFNKSLTPPKGIKGGSGVGIMHGALGGGGGGRLELGGSAGMQPIEDDGANRFGQPVSNRFGYANGGQVQGPFLSVIADKLDTPGLSISREPVRGFQVKRLADGGMVDMEQQNMMNVGGPTQQAPMAAPVAPGGGGVMQQQQPRPPSSPSALPAHNPKQAEEWAAKGAMVDGQFIPPYQSSTTPSGMDRGSFRGKEYSLGLANGGVIRGFADGGGVEEVPHTWGESYKALDAMGFPQNPMQSAPANSSPAPTPNPVGTSSAGESQNPRDTQRTMLERTRGTLQDGSAAAKYIDAEILKRDDARAADGATGKAVDAVGALFRKPEGPSSPSVLASPNANAAATSANLEDVQRQSKMAVNANASPAPKPEPAKPEPVEILPGVYRHGRGQYSDDPKGMGFPEPIKRTAQEQARLEATINAMAERDERESSARIAAKTGDPYWIGRAKGFNSEDAEKYKGQVLAAQSNAIGNQVFSKSENRALNEWNDLRSPMGIAKHNLEATLNSGQYNAGGKPGQQGLKQQAAAQLLRDLGQTAFARAGQQEGHDENTRRWNAGYESQLANDNRTKRIEDDQLAFSRTATQIQLRDAQRKEAVRTLYSTSNSDKERSDLVARHPDIFGSPKNKPEFHIVNRPATTDQFGNKLDGGQSVVRISPDGSHQFLEPRGSRAPAGNQEIAIGTRSTKNGRTAIYTADGWKEEKPSGR